MALRKRSRLRKPQAVDCLSAPAMLEELQLRSAGQLPTGQHPECGTHWADTCPYSAGSFTSWVMHARNAAYAAMMLKASLFNG